MALSPDGARLYLGGQAFDGKTGYGLLAVTYDAVTGDLLWAQRYHFHGDVSELTAGVAVAPDGARIYLTGTADGGPSGQDYLTVGVDAANGSLVWARRYDGPSAREDEPYAIAAGSDGSLVFVTGHSFGDSAPAYATVAYDAATGDRAWVERYTGPKDLAEAFDLTAAPDATRVYVTGFAVGPDTGRYVTVAYDAATGARVWVEHYGWAMADYANTLAVSPDGTRLYVAGPTQRTLGHYEYVTVAYAADTGEKVWLRHYDGTGSGGSASAVAVAPDGAAVFVTGSVVGTGGHDYGTVAYNAS
jgi:hypothetical protein